MLKNTSILITAGPTWEAIDPVRGISNHSSGKMGYALAQAATELGANVTLISGPVCLNEPPRVSTLNIQSALELFEAVHQQINTHQTDIFISVAAVADYRPVSAQTQKIKKSADEITLTLVKNPDIVASVAALKTRRPFTVGFAAETENVNSYARGKLEAKNLDMIIANDVSQAHIGFGSDQNHVTLITTDNELDLGQHDKSTLANLILSHISEQYQTYEKRTT
ncbi:MAG: bifunctional phosphopantothenoylcysteine decarboxylase/phosphopantothenate--cysteine ligase CoaBC [Arenicellales bacterium]